jgi:hypothetical protein
MVDRQNELLCGILSIIEKNLILILIWSAFLLIFFVTSYIYEEEIRTIIGSTDLTLTISAAIASIVIISLIIWMSIIGSRDKNLWYKNPLGLPAGSVRALIALIFVFSYY